MNIESLSLRYSVFTLNLTRHLSSGVVVASLLTSFVLLVLYQEMGGPGDQVLYYEQAAQLIPFTHTAYGPVYFVVLRIMHDLTGLEWFLIGKLISWLSAGAFILLCYKLFKRLLLDEQIVWLALALVAMNPVFIGESYDALTIMFGSALMLGAVVLTLSPSGDRPAEWVWAGLLFGIAFLTRFQALGLLIGAAFGVFLLRGCSVNARIKSAGVLLGSALLPVVIWYGFLLLVQGYIPKNTNAAHLALALEPFKDWSDTASIRRYDSFLDVLGARPTAFLEIAAFAAKNALKFPFTVGYELFFLGAGWLIPGAIATFAQRNTHWPSLLALTAGLVSTGIGSLGWIHYYVAFIPLGIIFVASAIQVVNLPGFVNPRAISWAVVLGSTILWSPGAVRTTFLNTNWPEFAAARAYIEARKDPKTLVSTTAAGFRYGLTVPFVDLDDILRPGESKELVSRLREKNVTYLVITERHTLYNFPDFKYLLEDRSDTVPHGLRRELLIQKPRRLAVYSVVPK